MGNADEGERKELERLAGELIRIRSYSGEEREIAHFLRDYMLVNGFDTVRFDKYGSVIGCISGKGNGKNVLMDGHIDTVRADDAALWSKDPFDPWIGDGKMHGRGASDMKGAVACMIRAAVRFARESGRAFGGNLFVSCSVQEECFEGIASLAVADEVKPDFVVIGESTDGALAIGQRGRAEVVIETEGVSCHSANPEKGSNAVYAMCAVIEAMRGIRPNGHQLLGDGIFELTDVISDPYPGSSVVPSKCVATFDRRTLPGEDEESILSQARQAIGRAAESFSGLKAIAYVRSAEAECWTGETIGSKRFFPAWIQASGSEIVTKAAKGLEKAFGKCVLSHYGFCTNGSGFAGMLKIPCVGFGPSVESLAHSRDEYVKLEDLHSAADGYVSIVRELLS